MAIMGGCGVFVIFVLQSYGRLRKGERHSGQSYVDVPGCGGLQEVGVARTARGREGPQ
jgi:hypothetical protein